MSAWNPNYVAYAASHGRGPQEQLAADAAEWPGSAEAPFSIWISEQLRAFLAERPAAFGLFGTLREGRAFTAFLHQIVREGRGGISWS